jgi:phosphoenolpyruvate carboxykinase (GTP)
VQKHLEKIERIWRIFEQIPDMPKEAFEQLRMQKERLKQARDRWGDPIPPYKFYRK